VHLHGVDVGAVQQRLVGGRVVGPDALDQLELAQDLLALAAGVVRRRRRLGRSGVGERLV